MEGRFSFLVDSLLQCSVVSCVVTQILSKETGCMWLERDDGSGRAISKPVYSRGYLRLSGSRPHFGGYCKLAV